MQGGALRRPVFVGVAVSDAEAYKNCMRFMIALVLAICASSVSAQVHVIDGDTLDLDGVRYKLNGIDAPERGQRCTSKAGLVNCGGQAADLLKTIISRGDINCVKLGPDPVHSARWIGRCRVDGRDVAEILLERGMAWVYWQYIDVYEAETVTYPSRELAAKTLGLGVWAGKNQPAWDYRAARWKVEKQIAPEGCPIKGNFNGKERIYHMPWDQSYDRTRISPERGERWFCEEKQAEAAGWRRAYR